MWELLGWPALAMKAFIRGVYIREICKHKSKNRKLTMACQIRVEEIEREHIQNPPQMPERVI